MNCIKFSRLLIIVMSMMLLASCANRIPSGSPTPKQEPTEPLLSPRVSDVMVELSDCYSSGAGGFVI